MNVTTFKKNLKNIARASLFMVEIFANAPAGSVVRFESHSSEIFKFRAKRVTMPKDAIVDTPVWYFGRQYHLPSVRDTATNQIQMTLFSDNDWMIYKEIFKWHNQINEWLTNHNDTAATDYFSYKCDMLVTMKNTKGEDTLKYKFVGCWPTELGVMELDWNENKVADYQVTFVYDYCGILKPGETEISPLTTVTTTVTPQ
jgi:hypothetical protein